MKEISPKIEEILSINYKISEEIERNIKKSETLRQSILKQAFSGKLVPQDPNDEPAVELLNGFAKEKNS